MLDTARTIKKKDWTSLPINIFSKDRLRDINVHLHNFLEQDLNTLNVY